MSLFEQRLSIESTQTSGLDHSHSSSLRRRVLCDYADIVLRTVASVATCRAAKENPVTPDAVVRAWFKEV